MRPAPFDPTRRALLARTAEIATLTLATAALGSSTPAAAKAAKSEFMYQNHRHDGRGCGDCKFFAPDAADPARGSCAIVEGAVSREGWCTAFVPRVLARADGDQRPSAFIIASG